MSTWLALIIALLNRGACWMGHGATTNRCNLY